MAKREFNPKSFFLIFVTISLSTLFLFFSSIYATEVYSNIFEEETFGNEVKIGSISIEHLTKNEAIAVVNKKVSNWKKDAPVYLVYNDIRVLVNPDAWVFQVEDSIERASTTSNKLLVHLNKELVTAAIAQLNVTGLNELLNEEMLFAHLKQVGENLQLNNQVEMNQFLSTFGQSEEVVSERTVKLPGEHLLLEDWIKGLDGFVVKPGGTFSLIHAIEEVSQTAQDSIDLNILASAIYTAVQNTNFTIIERHTSREVPEYTSLGYEAFVKPADKDFVFQNPNATSYKLSFLISDNQLVVSVIGVPFPYTYKMKMDKQVFKPKTIIHFNDQLADISSSVVVNGGSEGFLGTVYRESYGLKGEMVDSVKLAEDFYPPKHRIEERGYPREEVEQTVNPTIPGTTPDVPPIYPGYGYPYPGFPNMPVLPGIPGTEAIQDTPDNGNSEENREKESKLPANGGKENGGEAE
ncbi:VanW family protein [Fictibacillus nanhaiensis]|uniref:VanW family protein n=1 Tax=Fictibacillus nanhaiensis TaxID=742169 RepID=UPI001C939B0F|nr:VanW family protein [Fictibacillus nanhaiensis]MBY6037048.1 VanW family protein [Fictibacillus nanhaiensis]